MRHNFLVGERGVGKTYGLTRWVLNQCIKKHRKKFIWVRNSDKALEELLSLNAVGFLADHCEALNIDQELFKVKKSKLLYDGEVVGDFLPLSGFFKIKGINYDDYEIFIFDEFMPETGEVVRVDYEYALKSIMQSVFRTRTNFIAIYMANVLKTSNNMLDFFNFSIEPRFEGQTKQINRKLSAIIFYLKKQPSGEETEEVVGDAFALANKYTESPLILNYLKNIDKNCGSNMKKKELLFYLNTDTKIFLLREYKNKVAVMAVKNVSPSINLPMYSMHKKFVYGEAVFNKDIKKHLEKLWVNNVFVFKSEYVLNQFVRGLMMQ